ncbi:PAS domain S-box protein, partial [bacterium]|nr:PAS domain S-box protein [bacterium]
MSGRSHGCSPTPSREVARVPKTVDQRPDPRVAAPTSAPSRDEAWRVAALEALVTFASSERDETDPDDVFPGLVAMMVGPAFGYGGAAIYHDQPTGWHRVAASGAMAQPHLPTRSQPWAGTLEGGDLRLELTGGGGGRVLLLRRGEEPLTAAEQDLLPRLTRLVNTQLDQHSYASLLADSEQHYRQLYAHANLGIFFSRVGSGLRAANPGMLGILGYATEREMRDAVCPRRNRHFYDPSDDRERLVEQLLTDGQVRDFQTRLRRADGSLIPVSMTACLVRGSADQTEDVEYFGFVTDLTLDESHADAQRGQRRAEAANLNKTRFLAALSHELRTPLNGVMGMAEMLTGSDLDPEDTAAVDVIRDSARQLLDQVDRMYLYTSLEMGSLELDHGPFSPTEMVAGVKARWTRTAVEAGLDLAVVAGEGADTRVHGDARRCAQILDLLLENAVKFTDRRGHVEIRVEPDGDALHLRVSDTGRGMTEEQLASLIDGDPGPTAAGDLSGAGLGIAMVRRLVELMDGRLWMDSDPGLGSCFSVLLPLPRIESGPASFADATSSAPTMRVLVVED